LWLEPSPAGLKGGNGDRYMSTGMLVVEVGHLHHPLFAPFSPPVTTSLLALVALLSRHPLLALLGFIAVDSHLSLVIAVSLAVKISHPLRLQHWLYRLAQ